MFRTPQHMFYELSGRPAHVKKRKPISKDADCCICGMPTEGVAFLLSDVVSGTFGEYGFFKNKTSPYVCRHCEFTFRDEHRLCSAIILSKSTGAVVLEKGSPLQYILTPPKPPFLIAIKKRGSRKHFLHQGTINYSQKAFLINGNEEAFYIDHQALTEVVEIFKTQSGDEKKKIGHILGENITDPLIYQGLWFVNTLGLAKFLEEGPNNATSKRKQAA